MYRPWTTLFVQHFQTGPDELKGKGRLVSVIGSGLTQDEIDISNKLMTDGAPGEKLLHYLMSRGFEPFQLIPEQGKTDKDEDVSLHVWLLKRPDLVGLERFSPSEVEEISERPVRSSEDVRPGE